MDLTNMQVSHKKFGIGTVEEHDFEVITVKFANETKKFQYPLAFERFLELLDAAHSRELKEELEMKKEEIRNDEMKKTAERLLEIAEEVRPKPVRDINKSKDILRIHQTCFDFMIDYQKEHKDFYFVPRKVNNSNRLNDGYYFIGNDNYLMISFWNGGDGKEKIHNLNFGITESGDCFLEISSRDSEKKADLLRELVRILEEKNHYKFDEIKVNKWRLDYDASLPYLDVLECFILNEKAVIDEYLRKHKDAEIGIADQKMHDKYVQRILNM
ncbi:MAG: hypothetical protein H6Q58_1832 [Firmicutes bacterium]|nr:hypothetical protein [Bacillota bacterium]